MSTKTNKKSGSRLLTFLLVIFIVIFIAAAVNIGRILYNYKKGDNFYSDTRSKYTADTVPSSDTEGSVQPEVIPEPGFLVNFAELKATNPDIVGWICIPNTPVDYPIMFSGNDDTYLRHTYTKEYNVFGSIFISEDCGTDLSAQHTIIYGHNTKNGAMFGSLKKYKDAAYFNDHPYIYIMMPGMTYKYRIISAFTTNTYTDVYQITYTDTDTFCSWYNNVLKASVINTDAQPASGQEKVLSLSTCTSRTKTERFVVNAVLESSYTCPSITSSSETLSR